MLATESVRSPMVCETWRGRLICGQNRGSAFHRLDPWSCVDRWSISGYHLLTMGQHGSTGRNRCSAEPQPSRKTHRVLRATGWLGLAVGLGVIYLMLNARDFCGADCRAIAPELRIGIGMSLSSGVELMALRVGNIRVARVAAALVGCFVVAFGALVTGT